MTYETELSGTVVRIQLTALLQERRGSLWGDLAAIYVAEMRSEISAQLARRVAELAVDLLIAAVRDGQVDTSSTVLADFDHAGRSLMQTAERVRAIYFAERVILDELALDDRMGATSEAWPLVTHLVRRGSFDVIGSLFDRLASVPVDSVRDALTTLIVRPVFDLVLAQEVQRAQREGHQLALILSNVDHLGEINATFGFGVGDRLLERLGIFARRFFRTHDWVARYGGDSFVALLPQTSLDDAADLGERLRMTVEQRLTLKDEHARTDFCVTVSVAVVGGDVIEPDIQPHSVMAEAEQALRRAKRAGRNRVERVALLPTTTSILGAAHLLGATPFAIRRLLRTGQLTATRQGRHRHIDRASLEKYRLEQLARQRGQPH